MFLSLPGLAVTFIGLCESLDFGWKMQLDLFDDIYYDCPMFSADDQSVYTGRRTVYAVLARSDMAIPVC